MGKKISNVLKFLFLYLFIVSLMFFIVYSGSDGNTNTTTIKHVFNIEGKSLEIIMDCYFHTSEPIFVEEEYFRLVLNDMQINYPSCFINNFTTRISIPDESLGHGGVTMTQSVERGGYQDNFTTDFSSRDFPVFVFYNPGDGYFQSDASIYINNETEARVDTTLSQRPLTIYAKSNTNQMLETLKNYTWIFAFPAVITGSLYGSYKYFKRNEFKK